MEKWEKIFDLLAHLEELDPRDADAYLEELSLHQPELTKQAKRMREMPSSFMEDFGLDWMSTSDRSMDHELASIESFEDIKLLGKGGMGEVYFAREIGDLHRAVAIKIMPVAYHDEFHKRFLREARAHSFLKHRHIAQVHTPGFTPKSHLPYFTMEYVDGPNIGEYCRSNVVGVEDKLRLYVQICEGIAHAHQKGIIHRDLKPGNILVAEDEDKPLAKVIDFGIAKFMDDPASDRSFETVVGTRMGTPAYMSPEQYLGKSEEIDSRSDIYGLGGVLYALLTGKAPFYREQLGKRSELEISEILSSRMPQKLAQANPALKDHGDLEYIVQKAMAKDPNHRYATVQDLKEDILRFLEKKPVQARQGNRWYRTRLFLVRNRWRVSVAAVFTILLLAAGVNHWANQREILREEAYKNDISRLLEKAFIALEPRFHDGSVSLEDLALFMYENADSPFAKANAARLYGRLLNALSKFKQAEEKLQEARSYFENNLKGNVREYIALIENMALLYFRMDDIEKSKKLYEGLLARKGLPQDRVAYAKRGLADNFLRLEDSARAIDLYNEALEYYRDVANKEEEMNTRRLLAEARFPGEPGVVRQELQEVLAWQLENIGEGRLETFETRLLLSTNNAEELEDLYQDAKQVLSMDHILMLKIRYLYLSRQGQSLATLKEAEDLLKVCEEVLGSGHHQVMDCRMLVGNKHPDHEARIEIYRNVLKFAEVYRWRAQSIWATSSNLAHVLNQSEQYSEAADLLSDMLESGPPPSKGLELNTRATLAESYMQPGQEKELLEILQPLELDTDKFQEQEHYAYVSALESAAKKRLGLDVDLDKKLKPLAGFQATAIRKYLDK